MKNLINNKKGITLITLIITIILLLILASVATYSGIQIINSSKLTTFTTEMKIMQTQVNELYQKYMDNSKIEISGNTYYGEEKSETEESTILQIGEDLTDTQKEFLNKLANDNSETGIVSSNVNGYRYWSESLVEDLQIEGIKKDFFVNIEKRSVVSCKGLNYKNKMYYTLEQLPNNLYNVDYDNKNTDEPTFDTKAEQIEDSKWKITVYNIQYSGYIKKWYVKYQVNGQDYWNTSEDLSFIVDKKGNTNIKIFNGNIESEIKNINIENNQKYKALHPEEHIPTGYVYKEGTVETGYVIKDDKENEFVWIPVKSDVDYEKKLGSVNYFSKDGSTGTGIENSAEDLNNDVNNSTQGDILTNGESMDVLGKTFTNELVKNMPEKELIINAGGFWVGRYEAGVENEERITNVHIDWNQKKVEDIKVKKGIEPARGITQEKALQFANSWGSGNDDENAKTVSWHSGLITGAQWDAMCNYIGWDICESDDVQWGNFFNSVSKAYDKLWCSKSSDYYAWEESTSITKDSNTAMVFPTGIFENENNQKTVQKNIYDIAGNVWEWTTEVPCYNKDNRMIRGVGVNSTTGTFRVTGRHGDCEKNGGDYDGYCVGFRIVLYVK